MIADDDVPTSALPPTVPEATPPRMPAAPSAADAASPSASASPSPEGAGSPARPAGDQPRRRRRRRRRHGPRPEGAATPPLAEGAAENGVATPTTAAPPPQRPRLSLEAIAAGGEFTIAPSVPRDPSQRRRRRRRRPKFPRPDGVAAAPGSDGASAPRGEGQLQQARPDRGPRRHGRGERREGERQGGGGQRRENSARGDGAPQEQRRDRGERREGERREGQHGDRDRRPRPGKGGKPFGGKGGDRGRGDRRDKPAPKLYSFESVVDRGFEDLAAAPSGEGSEAAAEAQTRRVDWTIVKRTVADQRAAKTVSALYILRRDGAETEFPNLGAARAAVNKTIVHPEKLTRAKADYPTKK